VFFFFFLVVITSSICRGIPKQYQHSHSHKEENVVKELDEVVTQMHNQIANQEVEKGEIRKEEAAGMQISSVGNGGATQRIRDQHTGLCGD